MGNGGPLVAELFVELVEELVLEGSPVGAEDACVEVVLVPSSLYKYR